MTAKAGAATASAPQLPLALAHRIPESFNLAAASTVVEGVDLPAMLPAQLRVPEYTTLQFLAADVRYALQASQQALEKEQIQAKSTAFGRLKLLASTVFGASGAASKYSSNSSAQRHTRVARWVIKRCIRAAFELVQAEAHCYTRDLYWCCNAVQQHLPDTLSTLQQQHPPAVTTAVKKALASLDKYVPKHHTSNDDCSHKQDSRKLAGALWFLLEQYVSMHELSSKDVMRSTRAALRVVTVLDVLALACMTTVPDQWRPGCEVLEAARLLEAGHGNVEPPSGVSSILSESSHLDHAHATSQDEIEQARISAAQKAAAQGLLEDNMVCASVSDLPAAPPVREFFWENALEKEAVCVLLEALQKDAVTAATFEPFVIRGGANSWLDGNKWSIDQLVMRAGDMRGTVRVSPSREFPFVMPAHADALAELAGRGSAPTMTTEARFQAAAEAHVSMPSHRRCTRALPEARGVCADEHGRVGFAESSTRLVCT